MTPTTEARVLSARDLQHELEALLTVATQYAALEDRIERTAKHLDHEGDDG